MVEDSTYSNAHLICMDPHICKSTYIEIFRLFMNLALLWPPPPSHPHFQFRQFLQKANIVIFEMFLRMKIEILGNPIFAAYHFILKHASSKSAQNKQYLFVETTRLPFLCPLRFGRCNSWLSTPLLIWIGFYKVLGHDLIWKYLLLQSTWTRWEISKYRNICLPVKSTLLAPQVL